MEIVSFCLLRVSAMVISFVMKVLAVTFGLPHWLTLNAVLGGFSFSLILPIIVLTMAITVVTVIRCALSVNRIKRYIQKTRLLIRQSRFVFYRQPL